jgi:hypothetical protein
MPWAFRRNTWLRPLRPLNLQERQMVRLQVLPEEPVEDEGEAAIRALVGAGLLTPPPRRFNVAPDLDMQYQVAELDRTLTEAAGELVTRHPLRAYDAVKLASALRVQSELVHAKSPALTFLSADDRLVAIAQAEGLLTDNPNRHL